MRNKHVACPELVGGHVALVRYSAAGAFLLRAINQIFFVLFVLAVVLVGRAELVLGKRLLQRLLLLPRALRPANCSRSPPIALRTLEYLIFGETRSKKLLRAPRGFNWDF